MEAKAGGRIVVVSPHLDDAVLGCGELLTEHPGTVVVTVFSGARTDLLSDWDRDECGFKQGDDVGAIRRAEDERALKLVGAESRWLDFWPGSKPDNLASTISTIVRDCGATTLCMPVGIHHGDHLRTADACRRAFMLGVDLQLLAYEDQPYAEHHPTKRDARLAELRDEGFTLTRLSVGSHLTAKKRALACYTSQLPALDKHFNNFTQRIERDGADTIWRMQRPSG